MERGNIRKLRGYFQCTLSLETRGKGDVREILLHHVCVMLRVIKDETEADVVSMRSSSAVQHQRKHSAM